MNSTVVILSWLGLAVLFMIIEAITVGLTCIWFAAGALVAMVLALLHAGIWVQIIGFLVVSLVLLFTTRKVFVEKLKTGSEKTNCDALIGEKAKVITTIRPHEVGQVKVKGQEWTAVSENQDETLEEGLMVTVIAIEGVKAVVKRD